LTAADQSTDVARVSPVVLQRRFRWRFELVARAINI
jgi:hypothetical protein